MALTNQTQIKELSDGGGGGTRLGQSSTDKISFYGAAPVARPTFTAVATTTATTALNETKIRRIIAHLTTLGLIA